MMRPQCMLHLWFTMPLLCTMLLLWYMLPQLCTMLLLWCMLPLLCTMLLLWFTMLPRWFTMLLQWFTMLLQWFTMLPLLPTMLLIMLWPTQQFTTHQLTMAFASWRTPLSPMQWHIQLPTTPLITLQLILLCTLLQSSTGPPTASLPTPL